MATSPVLHVTQLVPELDIRSHALQLKGVGEAVGKVVGLEVGLSVGGIVRPNVCV